MDFVWWVFKMGYKTILVERANQIMIMTLNRPEKLNAINL